MGVGGRVVVVVNARSDRTAAAASPVAVPREGIQGGEGSFFRQNAGLGVSLSLFFVRVCAFLLGCFVFKVGCLGLMSLYTKGALSDVRALPGERPELRRAGPLGRCLGEGFPCGGICERVFFLCFYLCMADGVCRVREIDHGLFSR